MREKEWKSFHECRRIFHVDKNWNECVLKNEENFEENNKTEEEENETKTMELK